MVRVTRNGECSNLEDELNDGFYSIKIGWNLKERNLNGADVTFSIFTMFN